LAEKHGVPLVMDGSWFNPAGWAQVSHFLKLPIQAKVVRRFSIGARTLLKLSGKHYWEFQSVPILKEAADDQSFDASFLTAPADCMLFGYFQSPLYFQSIAHSLRNELNALLEHSRPSAHLQQMMKHEQSVAIHVRRKDYLVHPALQVCDRAYYQHSIRQMRSQVQGAHFYVFSDDPEWCRAEFRDDDQTVLDTGEAAANPLHDLCLMSHASHHIIANSSYSWWAAWLGEKPRQQVMMPDRWFVDGNRAPITEKRCAHWTMIPTGTTGS
jgi:Glycosyl transferase family 11